MKQPVSMSYTSQVTCWAHLAMTGCCWVFSHIVHKSSLSSRQSESVESFTSHQFDSKSELEFQIYSESSIKVGLSNFRQILPAKMLHSNGRRFSHCIAKHKWQLHPTYDMMLFWLRHESNACILKHESHGQTKTNRFMNESMICVCQLKHLIPVSFTVHVTVAQPFAGSTCLIQKPKHQWPWVYIWLSWTRTGHEKGLDAHIFLCSVCTFSIPFAAWSDMTTSTRPHQQPKLAGGSSECIIKSKLWESGQLFLNHFIIHLYDLTSVFWHCRSWMLRSWLWLVAIRVFERSGKKHTTTDWHPTWSHCIWKTFGVGTPDLSWRCD